MKKTIAMLMVAIMVSVVVAPTAMSFYFIGTRSATDITATSATLNGDDGIDAVNQVWFEWGETTSYGVTTAKKASVSGSFTASISGLSPGTTYHYRALCSGATGNDVEFTTEATTEHLPEFSTIAIPVASILGLLFFFSYRKRKKE